MNPKIKYYIGLDIASETFAAAIFTTPQQPRTVKEKLSNSLNGFEALSCWLKEQGIKTNNSIICLEATGVYGEAIVAYLTAQNFKVAVEPPLKVKRAFDQDGRKTDPVDSQQIAE